MVSASPLEVGPCTITSKMGAVIGLLVFFLIFGTYWPFLVFVVLFAMEVVEKYKINEGICEIILKAWCCPCCCLLQMYNHGEYMEETFGMD